MGKTAAQRQREYRERKKANDPAFLERERARVHQYYRPAAQLGKRALAQRNRYALIRNQVSRMKKRERETGEAVINPVDPEIAGTALQIKIPSVVRSAKGKGVKKCRKRALAKANRHVSKLQEDIEKLSRRLKTRSKQVERLKAKMPGSTPTKKQAEKDLRGLNLSPSKRRCIKRKLLLAGALLNEMKLSKDSTSRKARRPLHSVVSGRITKKYRLISVISKGTGLSRNSLRKVKIKTSQITMEKRDCVSKQFEASVHEFMQREDNCRVQPGKGDATKVDGQKKQSVVLTDYLRNLHLKYLAENPATTLSLASFCRLRPKNIQLASFISRNACLCLKHQNMALKISAVRKCGGNLSQNPDHLVREETSIDDALRDIPEQVPYKTWKKVAVRDGDKEVMRMKIVEIVTPKEEFIEKFKDVKDFIEHVKRVQKQYNELRSLKKDLPDHHFIVQMDFAENFTCRNIDEVQTAYWSLTGVTLHPSVIYYKEAGELCHKSMVIISDELSHSASTVTAFID